MNWNTGFGLDMAHMEACTDKWLTRRLSDMAGYYKDSAAEAYAIVHGDPLIYEYQELGAPKHSGDLAFGITRLYPGTVGAEYYMTKGHFHEIMDTAEVYLCLSGQGVLVTENEDGEVNNIPLEPMTAGYVGKGYAHRVVNTGDGPMMFFFAFRADAGHRYGRIAETGFRTRIFEENGRPDIVIE